MKIKRDVFIKFLKKIKMRDEQEIQECLMDFTKDGLKIIATSLGQHVRVSGVIKTSAFIEYQEIGKIGINDFCTFIDVLARMNDTIVLTLEGSQLFITDDNVKIRSKSVGIPLKSEDFFNEKPDPKLAYIDNFYFEINELREVFYDAELNKDATINIETQPGKIIFSNTGKYKFRNEFSTNSVLIGAKSSFGKPLISALKNLDETIKINIANNYPLEVIEETPHTRISIIIAPLFDDVEEEQIKSYVKQEEKV